MIERLLFILVFGVTAWFAFKKFRQLIRNIRFGQQQTIIGHSGRRLRNVLLIAFGQQKMFKNWIPALLHLAIYTAFLITQIELIEILIDGFGGTHRIFASSLGQFYTIIISTIEILSVLALLATIIFLSRRNLLHIPRFKKSELKGWPGLDANLILFGEILLITGIFSMNGADILLQDIFPQSYPETGNLVISSWSGPFLFGGLDAGTLVLIERLGWWLHILVVFGFLAYLPYSKHLHIILAFPNTWFASLEPRGRMENMKEIMNEVKSMLGLESDMGSATTELPEFGANDVPSLSWKTILDAYTCTECGRCTAVCPANITGKKLSPRKVMMDIRDRAEEIGKKLDSGDKQYIRDDLRGTDVVLEIGNFSDGKSLFDTITPEEIHACTTCNACVEACPVMINPLEPILKLRRYEILTQSAGPAAWLPLFNSLENSGSAWQIPEDRDQWAKESRQS